MRDANTHAQRKEEACLEIAHSCSGVVSTAHPTSPEYAPEDPPKDGAEATNPTGEAVEDADGGTVEDV